MTGLSSPLAPTAPCSGVAVLAPCAGTALGVRLDADVPGLDGGLPAGVLPPTFSLFLPTERLTADDAGESNGYLVVISGSKAVVGLARADDGNAKSAKSDAATHHSSNPTTTEVGLTRQGWHKGYGASTSNLGRSGLGHESLQWFTRQIRSPSLQTRQQGRTVAFFHHLVFHVPNDSCWKQ